MPRREETPKEEVKEQSPAPKKVQTIKSIVEEPEVLAIVFTETELRALDNDQLLAILSIYGIDPKETPGKNTPAKMTRLILEAQSEILASSGVTPKGLELFKQGKSDMLAVASPSTITYKVGITKSLGQYESLRLDVGITLPVEHTAGDLQKAKDAMEVAREICLEKIGEDIATAMATIK